jgi:hypothetical protein
MGADLDAVVFYGIQPLDLPLDDLPDWEERVKVHGCEVVFLHEGLALAIRESVVRHSNRGKRLLPAFAEQDEWRARLTRCGADLRADAEAIAQAPRWHLDAHFT